MKKTLLLLGASLIALGSQAQQRIPLFEVFTSSTCGPCKLGNSNYESVVRANPKGDFVSIKYQEFFPGTGDPYCTDENVNRFNYYGLNFIPVMQIDGGWNQNAQSFTQAFYDQYKAVPAKFSISGAYSLKNRVVTGKVKFSPLVAVPGNAVLYIAITEDSTYMNKKSNGETAFFNVVKKMVPNAAGTAVNLTAANSKDSVSFTYTFPATYRLPQDGSSTNVTANGRINFNTPNMSGSTTGTLDLVSNSVENFANLRVVAWVEYKSGSTKEVYNAANLARVAPVSVGELSQSISAVTVYPNPATNNISVDLNMKNIDLVSVKLINAVGAVVALQSVPCMPGSNKISFETANLANGVYNVIILDSKNNSFGQKVLVSH